MTDLGRLISLLALVACNQPAPETTYKPSRNPLLEEETPVVDRRRSAHAPPGMRLGRYYTNVPEEKLLPKTDAAGATCLVDSALTDRGVEPDPLGSLSGSLENPAGAPLRDMEIYATCPDCNMPPHAYTDERGHFALSCLPVGPYVLSVRTRGFAEFPPLAPVPSIRLGAHSRQDGIRLVVDPRVSSIRGTLVSEVDGSALSNVKVSAYASVRTRHTEPPFAANFTDERGSFDLSDLPRGKYVVAVGISGEKASVSDVESGRTRLTIRVVESR